MKKAAPVHILVAAAVIGIAGWYFVPSLGLEPGVALLAAEGIVLPYLVVEHLLKLRPWKWALYIECLLVAWAVNCVLLACLPGDVASYSLWITGLTSPLLASLVSVVSFNLLLIMGGKREANS